MKLDFFPFPHLSNLPALSKSWRYFLLGYALLLIIIVIRLLMMPHKRNNPVAQLGGLIWKRSQFCRGWLITGDTGSGKTTSGINQLAHQVFQNEPDWGGLCIDEKGVYWETLSAMAHHYERESDLIWAMPWHRQFRGCPKTFTKSKPNPSPKKLLTRRFPRRITSNPMPIASTKMTMRRLEDMDSAALTYAEVKAIASGNPLVIEKAQVDAELIRLTRLRSAHAEEQYRIRTSLRHSHEEVETWTERLANLQEDLKLRQDTSGDLFRIKLNGQVLDNRGIAGELLLRRAEKIKARLGEDIRIGTFAGFDLFIRSSFNNSAELVLRGKNSYSTRVTDTALGTIRSLESVVQGFEERAGRLDADIKDSQKRGVELEAKVGAPFEKEERYHHLARRQSEIEEQLDLTKNQAPNQLEAAENTEAIVEGEQPDKNETIKPKPARKMKV